MSNDIFNLLIIIVLGVILANVVATRNKDGVKAVFRGVACMMATTFNALLGQPKAQSKYCQGG